MKNSSICSKILILSCLLFTSSIESGRITLNIKSRKRLAAFASMMSTSLIINLIGNSLVMRAISNPPKSVFYDSRVRDGIIGSLISFVGSSGCIVSLVFVAPAAFEINHSDE